MNGMTSALGVLRVWYSAVTLLMVSTTLGKHPQHLPRLLSAW